MRYTTIIDISECDAIYRNENIRLVYLHLVLKSGWHDDDRDQCRLSIRSLSADLGMTISAVRNALRALEKYSLLKKTPRGMYIRKFVLTQEPTRRAKTKREEELRKIAEIRAAENARREAQMNADRAAAISPEELAQKLKSGELSTLAQILKSK